MTTLIWSGLGILVLGSLYLIWEGYKVYKLFSGSIVGSLVRTLVIVLVVELYTLGVACFAFLNEVPNAGYVLAPLVVLWIGSLLYSILAIRMAHKQVKNII